LDEDLVLQHTNAKRVDKSHYYVDEPTCLNQGYNAFLESIYHIWSRHVPIRLGNSYLCDSPSPRRLEKRSQTGEKNNMVLHDLKFALLLQRHGSTVLEQLYVLLPIVCFSSSHSGLSYEYQRLPQRIGLTAASLVLLVLLLFE
jgi:hypothetical protein